VRSSGDRKYLAIAKEPDDPRRDASGQTCLKMPATRSTMMAEMRADKLSGAAHRMHRKNSPIFRRHLPISRWELYCDARKLSAQRPQRIRRRTATPSTKLARTQTVLRSQHDHRIESDVRLSVRSRLPLPRPQGFSQPPRRAAKAPHRFPKPDAGPLTRAAHGLTSSPQANACRPCTVASI
jgi:hypothetical protein